METLLHAVLRMTLLGSGLTALLLCLKPLLLGRLPAHWQRRLWILALLAMVLPLYRLFPGPTVIDLPQPVQDAVTVTAPAAAPLTPTTEAAPEAEAAPSPLPGLTHWLPALWLVGVGLYLGVVLLSYLYLLLPLRTQRTTHPEAALFEAVRAELGIRRAIPLYRAEGFGSPFLLGLLFPAVYLPDLDLPQEALRMIFLHELTHYRQKDLLWKWLALLVNAVHWFNPLAYLLRKALSEACELTCDQAVAWLQEVKADDPSSYDAMVRDYLSLHESNYLLKVVRTDEGLALYDDVSVAGPAAWHGPITLDEFLAS